jgi:hypothetical protein
MSISASEAFGKFKIENPKEISGTKNRPVQPNIGPGKGHTLLAKP